MVRAHMLVSWGVAVLLASGVVAGQTTCSFDVYGESSPSGGGSAQIEGFGFPAVGQQIRIQVREAPAHSAALLVVSHAPASVPAIGGLTLLVDFGVSPQFFTATTDADGFASVPLTLSVDPSTAGSQLFAQWIVREPGMPPIASNGLEVGICADVKPLFVPVDLKAAVRLDGVLGGYGAGTLSGTYTITWEPSGDPDEITATIGELALYAPDLQLSTGVSTGGLSLRLKDPVSTILTPKELFAFSIPLDLELRFEALLQDPDTTDFSNDDALSLPLPIELSGDWVVMPGAKAGVLPFWFLQTVATREGRAEVAVVLDGKGRRKKAQDKVKKKEICLKVNIVAMDDGTGLARSPVEVAEQIEAANEIWCEQCCIRLRVDDLRPINDSASLVLRGPEDGNPDVDGCQPVLTNEMKDLMMANPGEDCVQIIYVNDFAPVPPCFNVPGLTAFPGQEKATIFLSDGADTQVLAHELGHALGLFGHNRVEDNLMNDTADPGNTELTKEQCMTARSGNPNLTTTTEDCELMPAGDDG